MKFKNIKDSTKCIPWVYTFRLPCKKTNPKTFYFALFCHFLDILSHCAACIITVTSAHALTQHRINLAQLINLLQAFLWGSSCLQLVSTSSRMQFHETDRTDVYTHHPKMQAGQVAPVAISLPTPPSSGQIKIILVGISR